MDIKRSIKKKINKILGKKEPNPADLPIYNLYNTGYDKTVLISYITSPFRHENHFTHQNYITSHIVAECFSALGYNVDVVGYDDRNVKIVYEKYAVFFGFGHNLERSFYFPDRTIPRIVLVTGAHEDLHNKMSLTSVRDFYKTSGKWLTSEVNVLPASTYYSMFDADVAIVLAKGHILEDYRSRFKNSLHSLNNNIIGSFSTFKTKGASDRNKNFLFLSGAKLVTKGLHILLEVAKKRADLNFYVVVPSINADFEAHYMDILYGSKNVFLSKNLRMDSVEMQDIVERCSYSLAPSYIDGFPGGTIEPMSAGLIPIVSRFCGFPKEDFIFEMEDLSPDGLEATIAQAIALDDEVFVDYSAKVKSYTLTNFSAEKVKLDLTAILRQEIKN